MTTTGQQVSTDARRTHYVRRGGGDPDGTYAERRADLVRARDWAAKELALAQRALDAFDLEHEPAESRGRRTGFDLGRRRQKVSSPAGL